MCPGVEISEWLNGLGDDEGTYLVIHGDVVTNGKVRANWLRESSHIVALNPEQARLSARQYELKRELRRVQRRLDELRRKETVQ